MKILCFVNHYFGLNMEFEGKSSLSPGYSETEYEIKANRRKAIIEKTISQLKYLPNIEVKVCGIPGKSLIPIDIEFPEIKDKPLHLIYESLSKMYEFINDYDYFINIEDDIFLPEKTLNEIISFDKQNLINEIFLPNRLETSKDSKRYCVDLLAYSGWTTTFKKYKGVEIKVAYNPHSALIILSRDKFKYALENIDRTFRGKILYNELDSAFAYYHSPFMLYRSTQLDFHYVEHFDIWKNSESQLKEKSLLGKVISNISIDQLTPPIILKSIKFISKKLSKN